MHQISRTYSPCDWKFVPLTNISSFLSDPSPGNGWFCGSGFSRFHVEVRSYSMCLSVSCLISLSIMSSRFICMHACVISHFSHVWLFAILWTIACRLLCPWDSPGKNTGVGCHALLQLGSSMLLQTAGLPCFFNDWIIIHCICTHLFFFIHSSVNRHVVSISWQLWIVLLWTWKCRYLFESWSRFLLICIQKCDC